MRSRPPKKIIYFVSEDWYFCSHRLNLAIAVQKEGYNVKVLTRVREHGEKITKSGLELIPLEMNRHGLNPVADLVLLLKIIRIYRKEKVDIVHHVAMKPVLYGSLAAWLTGVPVVINALAGMGYLFGSGKAGGRTVIKKLVSFVFQFLFQRKNSKVIVQNPDDRELLMQAIHTPADRITLIKGAGVDVRLFFPYSHSEKKIVIVLVARMLWDKGIGEFVKAAGSLTEKGIKARFVLVGAPDFGNPEAIAEEQLQQWQGNGVIEWWGHCNNMVAVLQQAHIACLPSYREGLPKSLIEAAAAGLPIVTTDVPGCREVVDHSVNGLLVPVNDYKALVVALESLIQSKELREQMGRESRLKVERELSDTVIINQTLAMYKEMLR